VASNDSSSIDARRMASLRVGERES
jgi:hypothetical protein